MQWKKYFINSFDKYQFQVYCSYFSFAIFPFLIQMDQLASLDTAVFTLANFR